MDKGLDHIVKLISKRRGRYKKGDVSLEKFPQKVAELGIHLIASSKRMATLKGKKLRVKLEEVQDKIDDLRKVIFEKKKKL
jgi:hypothetical protein